MADEVLYEVDGRVATFTLNRPDQRNAVNPAVTELMNALAIFAVCSLPSGFLTVKRNVRWVVSSSIGVLHPINDASSRPR